MAKPDPRDDVVARYLAGDIEPVNKMGRRPRTTGRKKQPQPSWAGPGRAPAIPGETDRKDSEDFKYDDAQADLRRAAGHAQRMLDKFGPNSQPYRHALARVEHARKQAGV